MPSTVADAITQLQQTQKELRKVGDLPESERNRALIKLRGQFAREFVDLSRSAHSDPALASDRARAGEFTERCRMVQNALSQHQSKWMLSAIDRDPEGYKTATATLKNDQDEFFNWARNFVSAR